MRPDPHAVAGRDDLLRRALEGRLRELRELLRPAAAPATTEPTAAERGAGAAASHPEEILRRLMVSALAAARDRPGPGPDRERLFALLAELELPARSSDLRFLDAWNSAFEVLQAWPGEELARDDARRALRAYASLLESHVQRLGG